jgi:transposase
MLTKEVQVEIEVRHRQGKSIREIAREPSSARNTVRSVLRGLNDSQYGPRGATATKLQFHQTYIEERIEKAGKIHLSAVVLLRELRARSYDGVITQLKEYPRVIRPQLPPNLIVRFETEPGDQLQIDFVVFRRGLQPLRAFTAELGIRDMLVAFADNERTDTLIGCLESAFAFSAASQRTFSATILRPSSSSVTHTPMANTATIHSFSISQSITVSK